MNNTVPHKIIARIYTDLPEKFGIPRQSGLAPSLMGKIVFEPEFRNAEALRGLDEFSHLWLIWQFSEAIRDEWSPTVRPPRLGGNRKIGVFASRSPFRPNNLGLSSVKLLKVEKVVVNEPKEIDIGLIDRNPDQPRTIFDEDALNELASSIKIHGVISPIIVKEVQGRYVIIAGERRWRLGESCGRRQLVCRCGVCRQFGMRHHHKFLGIYRI